jgi:peptide/nickel transport system substrate-binding protein
MTSAEIVDPLTFVVHWSQPYAEADKAPGLDPMPRHLLEDLYSSDKANFGDSSRFRRDFVGTGAYRIKHWEPGSHIEYERFDDYYLGRPPLDGIVVRFMSDKNTILSNILAGTLDMVFHKDALDIDAALEAVKRWEGTGNQVRWIPTPRLISVEIQYRPEFARPQRGLTQREVRLALMHAIDRKELVAAVSHGFSPIADSWIPPTSKWAAAAEGAAPHYEYDVARAQRLLAEAGWTAGPDGILVQPASGERFELDLWNRFQLQRDQAIVADYWKAVGVQANTKQLPIQRDRELEAKINGGQMLDQTMVDYTTARLKSAEISSPANRWNARNLGGYSNPRLDALLAKLAMTIDQREAATVHRDLVREGFTDLVLLPFYFQVTPLLVREGVTGPEGGVNVNWNFYQWDKKAS